MMLHSVGLYVDMGYSSDSKS